MNASLTQHKSLKVFFFCALLLGLRAVGRLWLPDIWAEDGTVFIQEGLQLGWHSLFLPFAGYFHTLQRLITLGILHLFPVTLWPLVITGICFILYAFFASRLASSQYEWLIPNSKIRLCAALLVCCVPGTQEVVGSLANINWILVLLLALVALKDPKEEISKREMLFSLVVILSTATFFTLIPLFIWRYFHRLKRMSKKWLNGDLGILSVLILGVGGLALLQLTPDHGVGSYHSLEESPMGREGVLSLGPIAYTKTLIRLVLLRPWLGPGFSFRLFKWIPNDIFLGKALFIIFTGGGLVFFLKGKNPAKQALSYFVIGISTWIIPAAFSRPVVLEKFLAGDNWDSRYVFAIAFSALLFWICLLSLRAERGKHSLNLLRFFILLSFIHAIDRFLILPYKDVPHFSEGSWSQRSKLLEQSLRTGCPQVVKVPINPGGWEFQYTAPTQKCN